jgi:glycerol-3-phosphate acyltransferase PlsX
VVCDGFVGNIVLKTLEGLAKGIFGWLKAELTRNPKRKMGALLAKEAFKTISLRMDPEASGGALLLGLYGNVLKSHGSARERGIMNAVRVSTEAIQNQINDVICREIADANERLAAAKVFPQPAAVA